MRLKIIKTAVKPKIKQIVVINKLNRFLSACSFSKDAPPNILRYEGISGSTHGEKKDNKPAKKVSIIEGYSFTLYFFPKRM